MPQMLIRCPLHEFKLPHEHRPQPSAVFHLRRREALAPSSGARLRQVRRPSPHRPARASGRFANGHSGFSRPRNRWCSCARSAGVNPLRVLAAYISRASSQYPKISASKCRPPSVYPPITNSYVRLTRILAQAPERCPGSYRLSRRFATRPSNPWTRIAWINSSSVPGNSGDGLMGSLR